MNHYWIIALIFVIVFNLSNVALGADSFDKADKNIDGKLDRDEFR